MLIAVARDKFARGVGAAPVLGRRAPPCVYEQLDVVDALERTWRTDAHLVGYTLPRNHVLVASGRQPRLTKQSPADVLAAARFNVIFADVDNPGHQPWNDELRSSAISRYQESSLPFGVYHTAHGARFVLPLIMPVPVLEAEPLIRRAFAELDAAGFCVDWSAKDWTRHFRLPHVVRNGRPFRSPFMDLSRMRPVELEPLVVDTAPRSRRKKREPAPPIPFTPTLAEHWQARARAIGEVVRATVPPGTWHDLFLTLAGALLSRQVPPEHIPELVRLAAIAANSSNPSHHEISARSTVSRFLGGVSIAKNLAVRWPSVADAVHDALADAQQIHIAAQIAAEPQVAAEPLEETTAKLQRTIAQAPDGLSVIVAECGLGKTRAAQNVAAARASSRNPTAKRSPAQTKTSISVDKNELAEQIASDLARAGVPVRRLFGPLSVLGPDGEPICHYHKKALPLVEGGQSVTWEFCLGRGKWKCEYFDTCPAKDGFVDHAPGDLKPRVTVGTHALLRELDGSAGSTGLLVIDEPPPLLHTDVITLDDIRLALNNLASFERTYAQTMMPVLLAVRDWTDANLAFDDLTDTLERPQTVDEEGKTIVRPPIRHDAMFRCRADIVVAKTLGAASRTIRALHRAMTSPDASVRLELEPLRVVIVSPREDLAAALRREGACVAMDANADLHLPGFAKVVGYDPPVSRFVAQDGAPVERTMLRCGSATRRSWLAHGRLVLDTGLIAAIRGLVGWAEICARTLQRPVALGIITMRVVELALRGTLDEDVTSDWVGAKQSAKVLAEAKSAIAPLLASPAIAPPILLAHYGATRGLNRLAGVDCLATIGDPWPAISAVQAEADYLALDWEARLEAATMAELEQAHGRLRTVHRRAPAFALHVGRVLPGGSGWRSSAGVRTQSLAGGRPPAGAPMPPAELANLVERLGGVRATARALECSPQTISNYRDGRGVPPALASRLRSLATLPPEVGRDDSAIGVSWTPESVSTVHETPIKYSSSYRGFVDTPSVATVAIEESFAEWLERLA